MSRPSSSVPNQCAADGESRRAGRLMAAGSWWAIQGAKRAKHEKDQDQHNADGREGIVAGISRELAAKRDGGGGHS